MCPIIAVVYIIYTLNALLVEFIVLDINFCVAFQLAKWDRMDLYKEFFVSIHAPPHGIQEHATCEFYNHVVM